MIYMYYIITDVFMCNHDYVAEVKVELIEALNVLPV